MKSCRIISGGRINRNSTIGLETLKIMVQYNYLGSPLKSGLSALLKLSDAPKTQPKLKIKVALGSALSKLETL